MKYSWTASGRRNDIRWIIKEKVDVEITIRRELLWVQKPSVFWSKLI